MKSRLGASLLLGNILREKMMTQLSPLARSVRKLTIGPVMCWLHVNVQFSGESGVGERQRPKQS